MLKLSMSTFACLALLALCVLPPLPVATAASCSNQTGLITEHYTGVDKVLFFAGLNKGDCNEESFIRTFYGELYKDDALLQTMRYTPPGDLALITDEGLTPGVAVTYRLDVYFDNPDDDLPPELDFVRTFVATPGTVTGIIDFEEDWTGQEVSLRKVTVREGGDIIAGPGTIITLSESAPSDNFLINMEGDSTFSAEGASLTFLRIGKGPSVSEANPWTGAISITHSDITPPYRIEGKVKAFEGNNADCVGINPVVLKLFFEMEGVDDDIVVKDNTMPGCFVNITWDDIAPAGDIIAQDNTLASLDIGAPGDDPHLGTTLITRNSGIDGSELIIALFAARGDVFIDDNRTRRISFGVSEYIPEAQGLAPLRSISRNIVLGDNLDSENLDDVIIQGNHVTCTSSNQAGIDVTGSGGRGSKVLDNYVTGCRWGLQISSNSSLGLISDVEISGNTSEGNDTNIRLLGPSENGLIYNNIFQSPQSRNKDINSLKCGEDGQASCTNAWSTAPSLGPNIVGGPSIGGNFWSDYSGRDRDGDGFGDTAYEIGENNIDAHPLIRVDLLLSPGGSNPQDVEVSRAGAFIAGHLKISNNGSGEATVNSLLAEVAEGNSEGVASAELISDPTCQGLESGPSQAGVLGQEGYLFTGLSDVINAGESLCYLVRFTPSEAACPCHNYGAIIDPERIDALLEGNDSPVGGQTVSGSVIAARPEVVSLVGEEVFLEPLSSADVEVGLEATGKACLADWQVSFEVCDAPQGAFGHGLGEGLELAVDVAISLLSDTARVEFFSGESPGTFTICAEATPAEGSDLECPSDVDDAPLEVDILVAGIELIAEHDGDDTETLGTFIGDIEAINLLRGEVILGGGDTREVESMAFDLDGDVQVVDSPPFEVPFDMAEVGLASSLFITAALNDGALVEAEFPVFGLPIVEWADSVDLTGAFVDRGFNEVSEDYEFLVAEYPSDFTFERAIPSDIPLLAGATLDATLGFGLDARFNIDRSTSFAGDLTIDGAFLGADFTMDGQAFAAFDQEFVLLPGAFAQSRSAVDFASNRSFLRTEATPVLGLPIELALFLGAGLEMEAVGFAAFDQGFAITSSTWVPRTRAKIITSLQGDSLFGVASLGLGATACAEVDAKISYTTAEGVNPEHFGGAIALRTSVEGSLFFGEGARTGLLGSTVLGPFQFLDGPLGGFGDVSALVDCVAPEIEEDTRFYSRGDLSHDDNGNLMLLRTLRPGSEAQGLDTEIGFSFEDASGLRAEAPVTQNTHWELDPTGTFIGGGEALALWTTNRISRDTLNLGDILAGQDIAFARFNGETWSEEALVTEEAGADGLASVAYDDTLGIALALWVHHESGDITDRQGFSLRFATFDVEVGAWSEPEVVPGRLEGAQVFGPRVASNGRGRFAVVWVQDEDGESFAEGEVIEGGVDILPFSLDSEVKLSFFDGVDWEAPRDISQANERPEFSPDISPRPNGGFAISWSDRDREGDRLILRTLGPDGEIEGGAEVLDSAPGLIEGPRIVVDGADQGALAFRRRSGGEDEILTREVDLGTLGASGSRVAPGEIAEALPLTQEGGQAWAPDIALGPDGDIRVLWAHSQGLGEGIGAQLSEGLSLARPSRRDVAGVIGAVSEAPRLDGEGRVESLDFAIDLDINTPGTYSIRGTLRGQGGAALSRGESIVAELGAGAQGLTLSIDGRDLYEGGEPGPFTLTDISLIDHSLSPIVGAIGGSAHLTDAYDPESFAPSALDSDAKIYTSLERPMVISVEDATRSGAVTVRLGGPSLGEPLSLSLGEVAPGRFEGEVEFTLDPEGEGVLVEPSGLLELSYDDGDGRSWTRPVGWFPPVTPVHSLEVSIEPRRSGQVSRVGEEGIDCGQDCFHSILRGESVTLIAEPRAGQRFAGWDSRVCEGTLECDFEMNRDTEVIARFEPSGGDITPTPVSTPTLTPTPEQTPSQGGSPTPGDPSQTPTLGGETPTPGGETPTEGDEGSGCACVRGPVGGAESALPGVCLALGLVGVGRRRK